MITGKQRAVLDAIREFKAEHGCSPSVKELKREARTTAVHRHLTVLRAKGYTGWQDGKARTLEVKAYTTERGMDLALKTQPKG